jgi:hypothetical protein
MKIEQERKRIGLFKVITKDVYITDDGKEFYDKIEAEEWEWFLNNKSRIKEEYKFEDVSPITLGLRYIISPVFSYKFYIKNYDKTMELEISNYLHGLIIESGIDFHNGDVSVKTHIENKSDGWHVVILNRHYQRGNELHFFFMTDLVGPKVINE